jgi:RHS repeat-associated protein
MPSMMKKLLLALGACVLPVSLFAATYVVPVATARLKDRIYSSTIAFHNEGSLPARCEAIYAVPNDPKGGTLRTTYEIAAGGAPLVEEDVLRDVGAVGTIRIACTGDVAIAARIQSSSDGLIFDAGRTFAALREDGAVAHGALPTIRAFGDVVVAEVAGKPVTVEAIVRDPNGVELGSKTYAVPAFAQQLVNLSKAHAHATVAIVDVLVIAGDGAIVGADETRDTALLKMAVRMRPETRVALNVQARKMAAANTSSPASSVIRSLGTAAFKAAPFQDPFTGLVFMRERWYDPQTGTFLSTDPERYADSANLYSYCHGDPVNCTDPTGRLGDGGDLRADFREKENAARAKRFAAWCTANPVECRKVDVRGAGIMRMIGGVGQTAAGVGAFASSGPLPEPVTKGLGGTAIVRGIDNTVTGAVELWTGEQHDTVTGRALFLAMVRAGVSRQTASRVTGWTETGVDLVSTVGSSVVPGVNTALRLRPVNGIIDVGGTSPGASNLNPLVGSGQTRNVPNLTRAWADDIARYYETSSATEIRSIKLSPAEGVNWDPFTRGAYTTLKPGGKVWMNVWVSGSPAEQAATRAAIARTFQSAGFRSVQVSGEGTGTIISAVR